MILVHTRAAKMIQFTCQASRWWCDSNSAAILNLGGVVLINSVELAAKIKLDSQWLLGLYHNTFT